MNYEDLYNYSDSIASNQVSNEEYQKAIRIVNMLRESNLQKTFSSPSQMKENFQYRPNQTEQNFYKEENKYPRQDPNKSKLEEMYFRHNEDKQRLVQRIDQDMISKEKKTNEDFKEFLKNEQNQKFSQFFAENEIKQMKENCLSDSPADLLSLNQQKLVFCEKIEIKKSIKSGTEVETMVIELFESNGSIRGDIVLRLSSPLKLDFLYIGLISKEVFHKMKIEQNLRMDYNDFPSKMEELIHLCQQKNHSQSSISHKAVFVSNNQSSALLKIVQENEFRESDHISVRLYKSSDSVLISYLSQCLSETRMREHKLAEQNKSLSEQVEMYGKQLSSYDEVNKELNRRNENAQRKLIEEMEINQNKVKSDLEAKYNSVVGELQAQLETLKQAKLKQESELNELHKNYTSIKEEEKEKSFSLQNKTNELSYTQNELNSLKENSSNTIKELQSQNKEIELKLKNLEKEYFGLQAENTKNEALIKESQELKQESKKNYETQMKLGQNQEFMIHELRRDKEKLEKKLIGCTNEISKLEDILKQIEFKNENKKQKKKNLQNNLKLEKEKNKSLEKKLHLNSESVSDLKAEISKLNASLGLKQELIDELQMKSKENQQQLNVNGETIQFLNSRLEETQRPFISSKLGNTGTFKSSTNYMSSHKFRPKDMYNMTTTTSPHPFSNTTTSPPLLTSNKYQNIFPSISKPKTNVDAVLAKYSNLTQDTNRIFQDDTEETLPESNQFPRLNPSDKNVLDFLSSSKPTKTYNDHESNFESPNLKFDIKKIQYSPPE
jgi:hypothetical protein